MHKVGYPAFVGISAPVSVDLPSEQPFCVPLHLISQLKQLIGCKSAVAWFSRLAFPAEWKVIPKLLLNSLHGSPAIGFIIHL